TELTTAGGHMNVWGVPQRRIFEHRQLIGEDAAIRKVADDVHAAGARISINHPFATCKACNWRFGDSANAFDSIEVWNGAWDSEDEAALAWWDKLLRSGRHITAIGSSDSHGRQNPIGSPVTFVKADTRDTPHTLDAIAAGHVIVTRAPTIQLLIE